MEALDAEISKRFTDQNAKRWNVHLDATVTDVRTDEDDVVVVLEDGTRVAGELLLVATGRRPNTDDLGLDVAGVTLATTGTLSSTTSGGRHRVSGRLVTAARRSSSSTWRMPKLRTVAHNLAHPDDLRALPHDWVPSAVFTNPQIASVGARSQDLEDGRS